MSVGIKRKLACLGIVMMLSASSAQAALYSNGFETNTTDWQGSVTRVASGTNGIPSASGSFHAVVGTGNGSYTQWGGYNFGAGSVPTAFQEYTTSVDIYLNVAGGFSNDTRFDFSSAISNSAGGFQRDFIFNAGFYNDNTGPGAGTNRFVISAGNNSQPGSAYAKDPGHNPIAISTTGWYRFQDHFYDNGGVLAVDMSIFNSSNVLVGSWTLSNPADLIGGIGGNRYGWFDYNQFPTLAIDNASLTLAQEIEPAAVPEPASLAIWGLGMLGLATGAIRRRKRAN